MVPLCATSESDIAVLEDGNRDEFMAELGLLKAGLKQVIRAGYSLLNLQTYFASDVKEVREWTIQVAATALRQPVNPSQLRERLYPRSDHRV